MPHGALPFVASLDHVGPFARSVADLAAAYDAMQGPDPEDPALPQRPRNPPCGKSDAARRGCVSRRWAIISAASGRAADAVAIAASALGADRLVELPEAARARAAAFIITASEGANLHLSDLRARAVDFDPMTRDRFLAGALVPAAWVIQAQRFRAWFRAQVLALFREVDILLAPATPCEAPPIGQETIEIDDTPVPAGPFLGVYTQPLSFIGLPVVAAPLRPQGGLPIGVQIIAAPWREADVLRVAASLERFGVTNAEIADG